MSKILIIEDDLAVAALLSKTLESNNFTVICATDGLQGTTLAHNDNPDLIVLDLILPVGDGETVLRNLKISEHTKKIPIIVISATDDEHLIAQVKNQDIVHFFRKPLNPDDLLLKIQEVLYI